MAREERDRKRAMAIPVNDGGGSAAMAIGNVGDEGGESGRADSSASGRDARTSDVVAGSPLGEARIDSGGIARGDPSGDEMDYDDGIRGLHEVNEGHDEQQEDGADRPRAAEVEDYDDDEESSRSKGADGNFIPQDGADGSNSRSGSPIISSPSEHSSNMIWIDVDHPPEAVKLLLEYCYTNRVVPLGRESFERSCKKSDPATTHLPSGPVLPCFPNNGTPSVSFPVALAGVVLAEEACLPRFSLMCEVAASQLVSSKAVVEALALCSSQQQRTGNKLPILRKAAMLEHVLGKGPRGVADLYSMPSFARGLDERRDLVVPSLLAGVRESVLATLGPHPVGGSNGGFFGWLPGTSHHPHGNGSAGSRRAGKRDLRDMTLRYEFEKQDTLDAAQREKERKRWRDERRKRRKVSSNDPYGIDSKDVHPDPQPVGIGAEDDGADLRSFGGSVVGGGSGRYGHRHAGWVGGHKSRGSRGGSSGGAGGRNSRGSGRRRGGNDRSGFV